MGKQTQDKHHLQGLSFAPNFDFFTSPTLQLLIHLSLFPFLLILNDLNNNIKMGIFSRRQRDGSVAPAQEKPGLFSRFGGGNRTRTRTRKEPLIMNMSTRPSFGQWLKVTWLDLVTMVIMGIIGLGVSSGRVALLKLQILTLT